MNVPTGPVGVMPKAAWEEPVEGSVVQLGPHGFRHFLEKEEDNE